MGYADRNRKSITLPSGAVCVIRRISSMDFLRTGDLPLLSLKPARNGQPTETDEAAFKAGLQLAQICLLNCVLDFKWEGKSNNIVSKPAGEAGPGEISLDDIEQADAGAIIEAVKEFSGLGKEGAEAAAGFREETGQPPLPGPNGETVRGPANGIPQPVPA